MGRNLATWQNNFTQRKPASQWNAWFAAVVFQEGPFSWLKTHYFQPAAKSNGFPVGSLLGFGAAPDTAWMAGMRGSQKPVHCSTADAALHEQAGFSAGSTAWHWGKEDLVAEGILLGRRTRLRATAIGPQAMVWANIKNFLEYRSLTADFELTWGDERWHGAGLVEHASGGYLPVPALQVIPGAWQRDILWEPAADRRILHAALSARWLGLGFVPRAYLDRGGVCKSVSSSSISVEVETGGIPTVWSGSLDGKDFRAERSGKYLTPFRGGAFFGFDYAMDSRRGIGFSERILNDNKRPVNVTGAFPAYSMR